MARYDVDVRIKPGQHVRRKVRAKSGHAAYERVVREHVESGGDAGRWSWRSSPARACAGASTVLTGTPGDGRDDGGLAGVREPRRPKPTPPSLRAERRVSQRETDLGVPAPLRRAGARGVRRRRRAVRLAAGRRRRRGAVRGPQPGPGRRRDPPPRVRDRALVGVAPDGRRARRLDGLHLRRALPDVLGGPRLDGARPDRVRRVVRAADRLAGGLGPRAVAGAAPARSSRSPRASRSAVRSPSSRTSCASCTAAGGASPHLIAPIVRARPLRGPAGPMTNRLLGLVAGVVAESVGLGDAAVHQVGDQPLRRRA